MFNFLHSFEQNPILLSLGIVNIYWYGLLIVIGIILGLAVALKLGKYYGVKRDDVIDLSFWLVIFGIIGARIYETFLFPSYYWAQPLRVLEIWNGGLAIHGGIIAGLIVLYVFAKKKKLSLWKLTAITVPGLALAQAIGRWGNYFNNELFGLPTNLPWGIPVSLFNRPLDYISSEFFHPTFLYESLGCLIIFIVLMVLHKKNLTKNNPYFFLNITTLYLILYSFLRFMLEFIRLDETPTLFLRWPQTISLIIIALAIILIAKRKKIYEV